MPPKRAPLTYAQAGVDIRRGDRVVDHLRKSIPGIGGFGGLFPLPLKGWKEPVLVGSTDGVGTKLLVADAVGRHDTVGIDCVAMVVNDIVVCGAKPLFFLDYIGINRLEMGQARQILAGVVAGCNEADCPLIGGETAELPGLYPAGLYDLAGFGVGVVEKSRILDPARTRPGDRLIGIASSGLHSNGYSLARTIVFERARLKVKDRVKELGTTVGKALLEPTRIYVRTALALLRKHSIRAMSHITGGGIPNRVNRMLNAKCDAVVRTDAWPRPPIFGWLARLGLVRDEEMFRTFNMGLGLILTVPKEGAPKVLRALERLGEAAYEVGEVRKGAGAVHLE
ncbi:MAG: phosphoribosylformylglycinamidine cyclo-ligase [Candidatus Sumerlaeota bacterium]|nr:phosphoribosylformylglycinamidine cyclo-ligase [Candidatus Sumerlaeota bacterium]